MSRMKNPFVADLVAITATVCKRPARYKVRWTCGIRLQPANVHASLTRALWCVLEHEIERRVAKTRHCVSEFIAARQQAAHVDPHGAGRFDLGLRRRRGRANAADHRAVDGAKAGVGETAWIAEDVEQLRPFLLVELPHEGAVLDARCLAAHRTPHRVERARQA